MDQLLDDEVALPFPSDFPSPGISRGGGTFPAPTHNGEEEKHMLTQKVNADATLKGALEAGAPARGTAPVMATPAIFATPVIAKAAGAVVGAGAVTGAAYAAYKVATG
jgi:hypothetical protein